MKKSINVESWWIEELPNGVFHLLINTKIRWVKYHQISDEMYEIGSENDEETQEEFESRVLEIPEFLPKIENGVYLTSSQQNKDQISFYWMPYPFEWSKRENKILFKS